MMNMLEPKLNHQVGVGLIESSLVHTEFRRLGPALILCLHKHGKAWVASHCIILPR